MTCGVYVIMHTSSGKKYVGSSVDVEGRWSVHRATLNASGHHNDYLQKSWTKYDAEAFTFQLVEVCAPEELTEREQYYMDLWKVCDPAYGYNLHPTARSSLGHRMSEKSLEKMRKAAQRRNADPAHRQHLSDRCKRQWQEGKIWPPAMTPEQRQKISRGQLTSDKRFSKFTPEVRKKMSDAAKVKFERMRKDGTMPSSEEMARRTRVRYSKETSK